MPWFWIWIVYDEQIAGRRLGLVDDLHEAQIGMRERKRGNGQQAAHGEAAARARGA